MATSTMNVSLTLTTTPQSLYSLLAALNANASRIVAMVEIQGDDANTDQVIIGDSQLATTNFAWKGQSGGDIWRDEAQNDTNRISTPNIYLRGFAATPTVHVRVRAL